MRDVSVVYLGRDNHIEVELLEDKQPLADLSGITRVVITAGALVIDSDIDSALLNWSNDYLIIKLGLSAITAGRYSLKIETWDLDNPNGVVWTEGLRVLVRE